MQYMLLFLHCYCYIAILTLPRAVDPCIAQHLQMYTGHVNDHSLEVYMLTSHINLSSAADVPLIREVSICTVLADGVLLQTAELLIPLHNVQHQLRSLCRPWQATSP